MQRIALTSLALLAPLLIAAPAHAAGETCDGLAATIVVPVDDLAYPNNPYFTKPVTGTPGDDVIVGTALADTIDGAGGNDVICGLDGADDLAGGDGSDRLFGGLDGSVRGASGNPQPGDLLRPGPGDDFVDLGLALGSERSFRNDQVRYDDAATAVTVDLTPVAGLGRATGEGTDTIVVAGPMTVVGSPFDDTVTGSPYDDLLMTDRGSDVVFGGEGNDTILPDIAGYDVMETSDPEGEGFASKDTVYAGPGDDFISSYWGPTIAAGEDGDDYIRISDVEVGGNGTADRSYVNGGGGDDEILADFVRDLQVLGDEGDDEISHSLYGRDGRSVISSGGSGNDRLSLTTATGFAPGARITVDRRTSRVATKRTLALTRLFEHHALSDKKINWVYVGTPAKDDVTTRLGRSLRATTFAGRDSVEGTSGPDRLDLGRGRDKADGSRGRDTCISVERAKSCEVRRR